MKDANLLLLAQPALQAQVLHRWRPKDGLSQPARGRSLRNFMGVLGSRLQEWKWIGLVQDIFLKNKLQLETDAVWRVGHTFVFRKGILFHPVGKGGKHDPQVSSGMDFPQLTRRQQELQPRCVETVLGLVSQAAQLAPVEEKHQ